MAVAIAALVIALGGDAFASIPGPDGTVQFLLLEHEWRAASGRQHEYIVREGRNGAEIGRACRA